MNPWEKYSDTSASHIPTPTATTDGPWSKYGGVDTTQQPTPFYKAMGQKISPTEISAAGHPVIGAIAQTGEDISTLSEKALNGLTLGGYEAGLKKANIAPPNFDNTAPENKSGLNMMGDVANLGAANKAIGTIGSKVVAPAVKTVAKAVPEGLKQSSYALMQSIVNQLPKEFKYGANAGRAMVKEKFSGNATDIKEQADQRIQEIGGEGDRLASSSDKTINNSNAMKVIDDKIAELQSKSPRSSVATINKLMNAKKDLLGVVEDDKGNVINEGTNVSNMTPKETLDLKRNFDDQTAWKGTAADDTVFNKTMQQARGNLKDNLNDAIPGMKEWNQRYADLRAAQQAAGRKATYDQANIGMRNMLAGAIRGTVGITTLGAAIHGNGELAGEILAGWGAKEILGNPMVKSKVAQMLYNASESDKSAIFKAIPWAKKAIGDAIENFRQKQSYNPEVMPNRVRPNASNPGNSPIDVSLERPQGLPSPNTPLGLPNEYAPRRGSNPEQSMGGLPNPNTSPIKQPGFVPKGLPEPFLGRSGVDRPWENNALPSPIMVGAKREVPIYKGGTINLKAPIGVKPVKPLDKDAISKTSYPKYGGPNSFSGQVFTRLKTQGSKAIHPKEAAMQDEKNYNEQSGEDFLAKAKEDRESSIKMKAEMAKEELRNIQSYRKNLSGTIDAKEFKKGEFQDMGSKSSWAQSKSGGSALDDKASEFFNQYPEAWPQGFNGQPSDALREVIKDLSNKGMDYHNHLRGIIAAAKKIK